MFFPSPLRVCILGPFCSGLFTVTHLKTWLLTCHDRIVEVFSCRVQIDHLHGAVQGLGVLDHGGAVGALKRTRKLQL